jgi:uncharacterized membrane protein YebE (DUF533 family)
VDTSQILSIFLKGAMGSRGRKRARKAMKFLGGNKGFLTASTVLGAAGIAWGVWESLQAQSAAGGAAGTLAPAGGLGAMSAPGALGEMGTAIAPPLPPVPGADDRGFPAEVLRIVRLAVSAARADGTLLPAERALILSHAREVGLESVVELELAAPRPLSEIVGGLTDTQRTRDLYVLAYSIVRADETVSGAERVYLAQLAHQLGLDPATVAQLESDTGATIDAQTLGDADPAAPPGQL